MITEASSSVSQGTPDWRPTGPAPPRINLLDYSAPARGGVQSSRLVHATERRNVTASRPPTVLVTPQEITRPHVSATSVDSPTALSAASVQPVVTLRTPVSNDEMAATERVWSPSKVNAIMADDADCSQISASIPVRQVSSEQAKGRGQRTEVHSIDNFGVEQPEDVIQSVLLHHGSPHNESRQEPSAHHTVSRDWSVATRSSRRKRRSSSSDAGNRATPGSVRSSMGVLAPRQEDHTATDCTQEKKRRISDSESVSGAARGSGHPDTASPGLSEDDCNAVVYSSSDDVDVDGEAGVRNAPPDECLTSPGRNSTQTETDEVRSASSLSGRITNTDCTSSSSSVEDERMRLPQVLAEALLSSAGETNNPDVPMPPRTESLLRGPVPRR